MVAGLPSGTVIQASSASACIASDQESAKSKRSREPYVLFRPSGPRQFFLFLRRLAGPPVGSAMPARLSTITTRLKGGAQASQTRRGNEPRPQHKHSAKILSKTPHSRHNKSQRHITLSDTTFLMQGITALNRNKQQRSDIRSWNTQKQQHGHIHHQKHSVYAF